MKNQFIPYELALKLKELGFSKKCIAYYTADKQQLALIQGYNSLMFADYVHINNTIKAIPAPLWQQAFDWFREKYNSHSFIHSHNRSGIDGIFWEFVIENEKSYSGYSEYQEARQACLEKLIEIVENQKK